MQEIVIDEDDENVSFLVNDTQIRYYIDGFCESSNRIVTYVKGSKVCTLSKDNFKALAFDCMPDDNPKKIKLENYLKKMEGNKGKKFAELIRNQTVWEKIDWEKVFTTGISIASLFV